MRLSHETVLRFSMLFVCGERRGDAHTGRGGPATSATSVASHLGSLCQRPLWHLRGWAGGGTRPCPVLGRAPASGIHPQAGAPSLRRPLPLLPGQCHPRRSPPAGRGTASAASDSLSVLPSPSGTWFVFPAPSSEAGRARTIIPTSRMRKLGPGEVPVPSSRTEARPVPLPLSHVTVELPALWDSARAPVRMRVCLRVRARACARGGDSPHGAACVIAESFALD